MTKELLHPLIRPLLADDWSAIDPTLPKLLDMLFARAVGEDWHKAGTFKDHLLGVYRILALWDQPREVRLLGLFHSVYSNEYVDLKLFDGTGNRAELAAALGEEAERLIHIFCTLPRTRFTQLLLEMDRIPDDGLQLDALHLSPRDVAIFAIASMADIAEQWHSWQDEIFVRYPFQEKRPLAENWAASLWPGPLKPTASALTLLSRMGAPLRDMPAEWGLPVPPVFDRCRRTISHAEEITAVSLYWQVVNRALPIATMDASRTALTECARKNPFVAEPHLGLAQLALTSGDWDAALYHAEQGLSLLAAWGVAWDKRIAWSGWVAWARILRQSAAAKRWPDTLGGLNGLGLVTN